MLATNDNSSIKSYTLSNLMSYCYGTEHYYTNPIYSFKYTDGVKIFCENAQSYWLLDIVNSVCRFYKRIHQDLIIIKLIVNQDKKHLSVLRIIWEFSLLNLSLSPTVRKVNGCFILTTTYFFGMESTNE